MQHGVQPKYAGLRSDAAAMCFQQKNCRATQVVTVQETC